MPRKDRKANFPIPTVSEMIAIQNAIEFAFDHIELADFITKQEILDSQEWVNRVGKWINNTLEVSHG